VWQSNIGGSVKKDPLRLQIARANDLTIAASRAGRVEAWDGNGKSQWQRQFKKDQITSGVAAADGLAVVTTRAGQVLALDSQTGESRWTGQTTASVLAPALIAQERVIVAANDSSISGFDQASGKKIWSFDIPVPALSVRGVAAPVLFDDRIVIIAGATGRIYGLDLRTGVPQWERRVAVSAGRTDVQRLIDIDGDPLLSGRQLYVVSYQGQLVAVDLDSQRVRWDADTSSLRGAATGLGNVYVATSDGSLQAYDEQDGSLLWEQKDLAYRQLSNPVVLGRWLVVGDLDGYLHVIEQTEGKIVGRVRTSGAIRTLRVVDDQLLVNSVTGALSIWQIS
ncbi:MAG: outer membrane protein assembly factor BamB, partial [Pseudomonadota bacterium]|nr:outer membrane protein assembly factor BamB [Pseudomonadota bacterium]